MKILVTGGAGYIGTTIIPQLLEKGHKVKIVVKFRGRERAHKGQANEIFESILNHMSPLEVKYDKPVDYRGHNVWCVLKV